MSGYSEFFLNTKSAIIQYECFELSHPNFSKTYYLVRNATRGLTTEAGVFVWEYYPLKASLSSTYEHLDQTITLQFGDLGTVLPAEIDLVKAASGFLTKPILKYRVYRSDDLSTPLVGPLIFNVYNINIEEGVASIDARAPALNNLKTGEIYSIDKFPGLVAFT